MSQDTLSIKLTIAGRIYPLSIQHGDEDGMRKAAADINERIKDYESKYAHRDKQDLLAMCALEFAHDCLRTKDQWNNERQEVENKLNETESLADRFLET
ncbi:MAG: cell division protein ZapA [Flavobacteriales bacterium]|nr:cell division protein ZapA [Flavobacteriales bacterium]MCB9447724.1 cell division protein ZapA [Flavobacteriales bacterium]